MKRIAFAVLATLAMALPATAESIGGRYQVQGTNFNGSQYGGEATITPTSETTCEIKWITGSTVSDGICMRSGNTFAASYRIGGGMGLVIYQVLPDGSMKGAWTIAGENGSGTEVLTPIK